MESAQQLLELDSSGPLFCQIHISFMEVSAHLKPKSSITKMVLVEWDVIVCTMFHSCLKATNVNLVVEEKEKIILGDEVMQKYLTCAAISISMSSFLMPIHTRWSFTAFAMVARSFSWKLPSSCGGGREQKRKLV